MLALGLDLGASSVKLALLENGKIKSLWMQTHQGRPFEYLQNGLEMLNLHEKAAVCVTGANSEALLAACPELTGLGDIPATVEGVRLLAPQGSSSWKKLFSLNQFKPETVRLLRSDLKTVKWQVTISSVSFDDGSQLQLLTQLPKAK